MNGDNGFIKHIVATKKSTTDWPEWKRNLMGVDEFSSKSVKVLNGLALSQSKTRKK
ncbi:hypothetical protein [Kosakonia sp. H7A]|uniref:hypothetical protein n=1 Tax=Kosakonia sp. H7A TaxID=2054598 RepID=UPI0018EC6C1B|nr:hypothetical protein [Kosakonia sp. H7A]